MSVWVYSERRKSVLLPLSCLSMNMTDGLLDCSNSHQTTNAPTVQMLVVKLLGTDTPTTCTVTRSGVHVCFCSAQPLTDTRSHKLFPLSLSSVLAPFTFIKPRYRLLFYSQTETFPAHTQFVAVRNASEICLPFCLNSPQHRCAHYFATATSWTSCYQ